MLIGIKEKAPINGALSALPDEAWSSGVSEDVARETPCRHEGVPSFLEHFVDRYAGHERHRAIVRGAS